MSIFQKWLNGQASTADPACSQAIMEALSHTLAPNGEQYAALKLIYENNRNEQGWAMILAFNLGQIVGTHQSRRKTRAKKEAATC